MKAISLITKDIYFSFGFDSIAGKDSKTEKPSIAVMDDGIRFLYFLDISCPSGKFPPLCEASEFFLERLRVVVPRNTQINKISQYILMFKRDKFPIYYLTQGERRVLLDMSRGKCPKTSYNGRGMAYKTWHNFKASGYKRLGIKNNITFIQAINLWSNWGQKTVFHDYYKKDSLCSIL